jgi:branched-chain amino acid transport system ATP-binding protein
MIELKHIDAGYGKLPVLKDVTMTMKPNELVAIIGPNGAGKSTVIKSIYNIADVTGGKVFYNNQDISGIKTHELVQLGIGYVPQGKIVFQNLSVQENLEIGCHFINDKRLVKSRIKRVYKKFPILYEKRKHSADKLSGGQRQMLAIGRALMQDPKVLLMDEPTLGLSPLLQQELFQIISDLKNDGMCIIVVEQNAKLAIESADKTYLLETGEIILSGGKEILKDKKIKEVYLGGGN